MSHLSPLYEEEEDDDGSDPPVELGLWGSMTGLLVVALIVSFFSELLVRALADLWVGGWVGGCGVGGWVCYVCVNRPTGHGSGWSGQPTHTPTPTPTTENTLQVDSIDGMSASYGVSKTFVGVILLPLVGNATEHMTAGQYVFLNAYLWMDLSILLLASTATRLCSAYLIAFPPFACSPLWYRIAFPLFVHTLHPPHPSDIYLITSLLSVFVHTHTHSTLTPTPPF